MYRAYKYRIYPNRQQKELIEKTFNCCRLVYNLALAVKQEAYKKGKSLSAIDLCYQLPDLKNGFEWLREVDSQALQASIKKIDVAYKNFFKGNAKYPRFKKKFNRQSFQCPNNTRKVNFKTNKLTIPKIKDINIRLNIEFEGKIKTVTISKTTTNKYFASILVEQNKQLPKKREVKKETALGIDLGLKYFITMSNGKTVDNPKFLRTDISRLKVLQRRLSKKKKGSKNRTKARYRVSLKHEQITNKRDDFLHKLSHRLIHNNQVNTICVEILSISNMVKNHSLAQAISDASWSKFITMLKYKSEWQGVNLIEIDRFAPSSKVCNNCGWKKKDLQLKDRKWVCQVCGSKLDRDINASKNIRDWGIKKSGQGMPAEPVEVLAVVKSMKQECKSVEFSTKN